jgi:hypothetical protein
MFGLPIYRNEVDNKCKDVMGTIDIQRSKVVANKQTSKVGTRYKFFIFSTNLSIISLHESLPKRKTMCGHNQNAKLHHSQTLSTVQCGKLKT